MKKANSSRTLRSYLLTGLVVWLPIVVTFVVVRFIIDLLDSTLALLPQAYQPEAFLGVWVPGLGVLFSLAVLLLTGLLAANYFGQHLFRLSEKLLDKIPLVRSIYKAAKQVITAVFSTNSQAFRKVVLIEYPRKGLWSIAFLTGTPSAQLFKDTGEEMVSVFVPTTPNPTSGFLMMVAKHEVKDIDMSIDEALKFIISLGVMPPQQTPSPIDPVS